MNSLEIDKIVEFLKSQPVSRAWIFGSFSRGEETAESDVDLLVEYIDDQRPGLLGICGIITQLEAILGRKVDLVENGTLYPRVAKHVDSEKIIIYERRA